MKLDKLDWLFVVSISMVVISVSLRIILLILKCE